MDLITMRAKLRTRLGVPSTDALYTDASCTSLINSALHYIETEADWGWLEQEATITTVAATTDYAFPTRYRSTITITSPDGYPLERATAEHQRLLRAASGVPKVYDVFGTMVRLAPAPTGAQALTHIYVGGEADLSADADLPLVPAVWHDAVVEYAAYLAFRRWGATTEAGSALAAYETWLEQMKRKAPRAATTTGGGEVPAPAAPA